MKALFLSILALLPAAASAQRDTLGVLERSSVFSAEDERAVAGFHTESPAMMLYRSEQSLSQISLRIDLRREQEALLGAAQPYLQSGDIAAIRLSTRPDAIDGEVLSRLRRCGVETIELGAQSMSDRVLALAGRGHTAQDVADAAKAVKAAGFKLILQMMTGLPGADDACDVDSARAIAALEPDGVRVYPTVIVRDTALYDLWKAGRYREHTVEDAVRVCARILPIFEAAGIPVIRLGLNPTEDLSGGDAVGGAYHPALGELVKSRIMREKAEALLSGAQPGSEAVIRVNPRLMSQLVGQHGANRAYLIERFGLKRLRVKPDAGVSCIELD